MASSVPPEKSDFPDLHSLFGECAKRIFIHIPHPKNSSPSGRMLILGLLRINPSLVHAMNL
jgi:hypothetical protein